MRPWKPLRSRPWRWWVIQGVGYVYSAMAGWLWSDPHARGVAVGFALIGFAWFIYSDWNWAWPGEAGRAVPRGTK